MDTQYNAHYKFKGIEISEKISMWFTVALERDVKILWSLPKQEIDQKKKLPWKMYTKDDKFGNFNWSASIHLINQASLDYVEKKIRENHENLENFDGLTYENFRPNILIDTGTAFSEDLLTELRAGNVLFRFVGPTIRCNVVRVNAANENSGENEPISTLSKFRAFPGFGVAFGNYYAVDLLQNQRVFEDILPEN